MQVQENAQKVQKRLINRPRHPVQSAADVVEQVLRTGGEHYLETMQHKLSWWQLSLLDVKLFLAMAALIFTGLVVFAVVTTVRCFVHCVQNMQTKNNSKLKIP